MKNVSSSSQELWNVLHSSDSIVRQDLCVLRDQVQLHARSAPSSAEFQLLSQKIVELSEQLNNFRDIQHIHYLSKKEQVNCTDRYLP